MAVTTRRKPGPVPKGARAQFTLRLPADQLEIYRQAAEDAGLALGDYIAERLAHVHELPVPEYVYRQRGGTDQQLPMAM